MALFLDSAFVEDARRAVELGFVWGATTNPALMAQAAREPADVIADFCELLPGMVFYQLTAPSVAEREAEALRMVDVNPAKVGLKIPCTTENLSLMAHLSDEGITCAATAVFSAHQTYLACEAGAHFVIPYVNRSTRLQGDGLGLVSEMLAVVEATDTGVELLAASVKTPAEVVETVLAGAHHLTLHLDLILALGEHPLSVQAIADFDKAMREQN
ncbi:MAG: transaldolase family protein [Anaerolineae bacterium]